MYYTGAHKSQKLKETCSSFWPHSDTLVCDIFLHQVGRCGADSLKYNTVFVLIFLQNNVTMQIKYSQPF